MRCAHPLASLGAEPYRIHFPADLLPLETDGSIPHLRCVFNKWEKPRQKQVMKVILKPLKNTLIAFITLPEVHVVFCTE